MKTLTQKKTNLATDTAKNLHNARDMKRCRLAAVVGAIGIFSAGVCHATLLNLPNGDFSQAANTGTIGGGLIGASGTNVAIGGGPWNGTYFGVLTFLAPPTLTINSVNKIGTISGLLGVNALGVVDNGAHFDQSLVATFQPGMRYTLISNMSSSVFLDLPLLGATNTGIGLGNGLNMLATSTSSAIGLLRLDQMDATTNRLAMTYDAPITASGAIGVELYTLPVGLVTANLVSSVSYSNIMLAESAIPPANSILTISGLGSQTAQINTAFAAPLVAHVADQNGDPVANVLVTLTAPASGAGATLTSGSVADRIVIAFTGADGNASIAAAANPTAGCYRVSASVLGITYDAHFNLRNYSTDGARAFFAANPNATAAFQDSIYCNGFE